MKEGVITGCNERQEWLLKTWWHYYSNSNSYPVTFIDFGMSKSARMWCEKRAPVIDIPIPEVTPKEKIDSKKIQIWDENAQHTNYWPSRPLWFAKPQAMLKSPYDKTAWIDLDTFVIRSIKPLIDASEETGIALALEVEHGTTRGRKIGYYKPDETVYNMGIISYKKTNPFIKKWAHCCLTQTDQYHGDQDLFIRLAHEEKVPIKVLPPIYNWRLTNGMRDDVAIIHFAHTGKQTLYMNLKTGIE